MIFVCNFYLGCQFKVLCRVFLKEWICFEEAEDSQERSKNPFFEESECQEGFVQQTDENNFHVPLTGAPGEDVSL